MYIELEMYFFFRKKMVVGSGKNLHPPVRRNQLHEWMMKVKRVLGRQQGKHKI